MYTVQATAFAIKQEMKIGYYHFLYAFFCLTLSPTVFSTTSNDQTDPTPQELSITLSVPAAKPWFWLDSTGQPRGYMPILFKEYVKLVNPEIEVGYLESSTLRGIYNLLNGDVDAIITGKHPLLLGHASYVPVSVKTDVIMWSRIDKPIDSIFDLEYRQAVTTENMYSRLPKDMAQPVVLTHSNQFMHLLMSERVDAVITSRPAMEYNGLLFGVERDQIHERVVSDYEVYLWYRKGSIIEKNSELWEEVGEKLLTGALAERILNMLREDILNDKLDGN